MNYQDIIEILNPREWAFLIWIVIVISFLLFKGLLTNFIKKVIKNIFSKAMIIVFLLMNFYIIYVICILNQIKLWECYQLKTTIIWYLTFSLISIFKVISIKDESEYFQQAVLKYLKNSVLDSFKLVGIIAFLSVGYTNIVIELFLMPIFFILGLMLAMSQRDGDKRMEKLIKTILSILVALIIIFTLYMAFLDFEKLIEKELIYNFFTPSLLTLTYIPFLFFIFIYTTYENVFIRVNVFINKRFFRFYAKLLITLIFNIRITLLERWATSLVGINIQSISDINKSVFHIFKMVSTERNPPKVDKLDGWSPYEAKDFLIKEGIKTRYYHPDPTCNNEWFCASDSFELGGGFIKNKIDYYVKGDSNFAKSLKLILDITSIAHANSAHNKFLSLVKVLMNKALGIGLPVELEKSILKGNNKVVKISGFKIEIIKCLFTNQKFKGYSIKFIITKI